MTTEIIHKERFEAWLFSQPDERRFDYVDNRNCIGCCFLREMARFDLLSFGPDAVYDKHATRFPLPEWFTNLLRVVRIDNPSGFVFNPGGLSSHWITFGEIKRAWLALFPETSICDAGDGVSNAGDAISEIQAGTGETSVAASAALKPESSTVVNAPLSQSSPSACIASTSTETLTTQPNEPALCRPIL